MAKPITSIISQEALDKVDSMINKMKQLKVEWESLQELLNGDLVVVANDLRDKHGIIVKSIEKS